MWNHCSQMGHCNHSFSSSVYHSPHVEHSLSLLLDFSWQQTTSLAFLYHWVWKASWSTAILKNSMLQSPFSLICWTNLWIECVLGIDGAWWMLSGSTISSDLGKYTVIMDGNIRKFFECMDHNLAWLYFSEKGIFDVSAYVIHCRTSTMTYSTTLFLLINLDQNWVLIPSLHKTTLVNDLPHSVSIVSITFFRQLIDVILLWSEFSVGTTVLLFLISFVTLSK